MRHSLRRTGCYRSGMLRLLAVVVLFSTLHALDPDAACARDARAETSEPRRRRQSTPQYIGGMTSTVLGGLATGVGALTLMLGPLSTICIDCTDEERAGRDATPILVAGGLTLGVGIVGLVTGLVLIAIGPRHVMVEVPLALDVAPLEGGAYVRAGFTL